MPQSVRQRLLGEAAYPGSFTYAAHHAFFGGFLPTPANTNKAEHVRLFHSRNTGMKTHPHTWLFDTPDMVSGLAAAGYQTMCIGGVIFFSKKCPSPASSPVISSRATGG